MSLEHSFSSAFERFDNTIDSAFNGSNEKGLQGQLDALRPLGGIDGRFEQAFDRMDTKFEEMDAKFNSISHSLGGTLDGFADSLFPNADVPRCSCTDGRFDFSSSSLCHLEFFDDAGHLCDSFDGTSCHKILPNDCACCIMHGSDSPPRYIVIDARGENASKGNESVSEDIQELQRMREQLAKLKANVGPQQTPQAPTQTPSQFAEFLPLMTQLVTTIINAVGRFMKKDSEEPNNPPKKPEDPKTIKELKEKIEKLEADKKAKDAEIKKLSDTIEELRKTGGTGEELEELEKRLAEANKEQKRLEKELQKLKNSSSSSSSTSSPSTPATTTSTTTSTPTSTTTTSAPPPITTRPLNAAEKREEIAEQIQRDLVTRLARVGITVTQRDEVLDAEFNGAKIVDGFTLKEALSVDDNKDAFVDELNKTVKDHLQTVVTSPGVTITVVDVLVPEAECTLSVFGETRSTKAEPKQMLNAATIDRLQKEAQKEFVEEIVGNANTGVNGVEVGTLTNTELTPTSLGTAATSPINLTAITSKADLEAKLVTFRDSEVITPIFTNIGDFPPFDDPAAQDPSFSSVRNGIVSFGYEVPSSIPGAIDETLVMALEAKDFDSPAALRKQVVGDLLQIITRSTEVSKNAFPSQPDFAAERKGKELIFHVPTDVPYNKKVDGAFTLQLGVPGLKQLIPNPRTDAAGNIPSGKISVTIPDSFITDTGKITLFLQRIEDASASPIKFKESKNTMFLNR